MKKIVLLDESERTAFLNYCEAIKNTEKDKDTFLNAARLTRHEAMPRFTTANIMQLAGIIGGTVITSILIICTYLSGNIGWAIPVVMVMSLMGLMLVIMTD